MTDKIAFAAEMRAAPTPPEASFWDAVKGGRLRCDNYFREPPIRFNRQQVILGYIADFYLPRYRAIIEIDGEGHLEQLRYDLHRDQVFLARDYSVFRIRARLLRGDPDLVLELVRWYADELAEGRDHGSSMPSYWTFDEYGVLARGSGPDAIRSMEHWYRVGSETPDLEGIGEFGSEIGDTDMHDANECTRLGCVP